MPDETPRELSPKARVTTYLTDPQRDAPLGVGDAVWGKVSPNLSDAIVKALVSRRWPLLVTGPVGTGKTCAMACVYRGWREVAGRSILWRNCGDLLAQIVKCRMAGKDGVVCPRPDGGTYVEFEQSLYSKIERANLLCLDDVGVKAPTEVQREIFNTVIDLRKGKPLMLTTNLTSRQFEQTFDGRTHSRVWGGGENQGCVIKYNATDRRFEGTTVMDIKD